MHLLVFAVCGDSGAIWSDVAAICVLSEFGVGFWRVFHSVNATIGLKEIAGRSRFSLDASHLCAREVALALYMRASRCKPVPPIPPLATLHRVAAAAPSCSTKDRRERFVCALQNSLSHPNKLVFRRRLGGLRV